MKTWEQQTERSTPFMLRLLVWAALRLGRRVVRLVLYPIVGYFLLTSPRARRASRNALRRLLGREPRWRDITRHFHTFAAASVDRFYLLSERSTEFRVDSHRPPEVVAAATGKRGCLLLVAHLGSSEVLRVLGVERHALPLSILMDRRAGRMLTELLEKLNPGLALHVIDSGQRGPALVLSLKEALEAGRMVGIMADRARADERSVTVDFLGAPARLPEGPWQLAAALGVPVILGFGLYRGDRHYESHFELLCERVTLPRAERAMALQHWAQRYAHRLEHYARRAPYNWFNFYDFWPDDADQH